MRSQQQPRAISSSPANYGEQPGFTRPLTRFLLGVTTAFATLSGTLFFVTVVGLWLVQAKSYGFGAADIFMYPPLILSTIVLLAFGLSLWRESQCKAVP